MERERESKGEIVLLCNAERRALYVARFESAGTSVAVVDDVESLIAQVVERPPLALFVDIVTGVKIGVAIMTPIYRLAVGWPILRCKIRPDGVAIAIGAEPPRNEFLEDAIAELERDPFAWSIPTHRRRYVRVEIDGRARIRSRDGEEWRRGNLLNIGNGGAFIAIADPPPPGEAVAIELWDHEETPIAMTGRTVWRRRWEDGKALAGVGVAFDEPLASPHLRQAIVRRVRRGE